MPGRIARIEVIRDKCIGSDACVAVAPKTFKIDDENVAVIIDQHGDIEEYVMMAAIDCPAEAILLFGQDGAQMDLEMPTKVPEEIAH
jgi:ferredoxin